MLFSQFPCHFTIGNFIIFQVSRPTLRPDMWPQRNKAWNRVTLDWETEPHGKHCFLTIWQINECLSYFSMTSLSSCSFSVTRISTSFHLWRSREQCVAVRREQNETTEYRSITPDCSTTEHIRLNSGMGRYIYRVTIDIDNMFDTAYGNYKSKKIFERIRKKKKGIGPPKNSRKGQLIGILTETGIFFPSRDKFQSNQNVGRSGNWSWVELACNPWHRHKTLKLAVN